MFGWLHHHWGGAGLGWGVQSKLGVLVLVPGRYHVPNMYCKTYCTIDTIILSLASDSAAGLENRLEKSSPSVLRRAAIARAGLFSE